MKKLIVFLTVISLLLFTVYAEEPSDWAQNEIQAAVFAGFVPTELDGMWRQDISRADFAHLAVNYLAYNLDFEYDELAEYVYSNTEEIAFDDTDSPFVSLAARLDITEGVGDGKFLPDAKITREQAATMLQRVYSLYSSTYSIGSISEYSDADKISEWAQYGVMFCKCYGVMLGVSEDHFDPQGTYTVEQAVTTFVRLGRISEWREYNFGARYRRKMTKEEVISEYEILGWQQILERYDTPYGTVLYMVTGGVPHAGSHSLILIKNNGQTASLTKDPPVADGWGKIAAFEDMTLSEDQRIITYRFSFEERAEMIDYDMVLHEAGTYYYEANLETGECVFCGFVQK